MAGDAVSPPIPTQHYSPTGSRGPVTVKQFLQSPDPTVLPMESAGTPALPLSPAMVAGSPYPHSAQQRLGIWNRATGNNIPMPQGTTYNSPRNRTTQV